MKKTKILSIFASLFVMLGVTVLYSCSKSSNEVAPNAMETISTKNNKNASNNNTLIESFKNSPEFLREYDEWKNLGTISLSKSYVLPLPETTNGYVIRIILEKAGTPTAMIEAVPVPQDQYLLPNNDKYAMVLRDYTNFDVTTKTGTMKYYDLNYNNHLSGIVTMSDASLVSWDTFEIPVELHDPLVLQKAHYCDKNTNGDVTFSECYSCMKGACGGSPRCDTMCDLANLVAGACTVSMAGACAWISLWY